MISLPKMEVKDLVLDAASAHVALNYLLLGQVKVSAGTMTKEDRLFAQKLLVHAIEKHYEMGYIEALFKSLSKIPKGPAAVMKSFVKKALIHWFKHATREDLDKFAEDPKLYQSVVNVIASRFRSVWKIREQTGMLIY